LKSGSDLLARHSGHLCLVRDKTANDKCKQLWLFDLDKRELIWKEKLSDNMEMAERDKNSLTIKMEDEQVVKLKFRSDVEAQEFFDSAKVTVRVRPYEREYQNLFANCVQKLILDLKTTIGKSHDFNEFRRTMN
jgi:WH1 domain